MISRNWANAWSVTSTRSPCLKLLMRSRSPRCRLPRVVGGSTARGRGRRGSFVHALADVPELAHDVVPRGQRPDRRRRVVAVRDGPDLPLEPPLVAAHVVGVEA